MNDLKLIREEKNVKAIIINDIIRLLTVYGIAHLLEAITFKNKKFFLNKIFLYGLLFFAAGIVIYHLLIKKHIYFDDNHFVETNQID